MRTASDWSVNKMMFNTDNYSDSGWVTQTLLEQAARNQNVSFDSFWNDAIERKGKESKLPTFLKTASLFTMVKRYIY